MSEPANKSKRLERQRHGWFASRPHSYAELVKHPLVEPWIKRYREGESQESYARGLQRAFDASGITVEDFVALSPEKAKEAVLSVADAIRKKGNYAEARKVVIATKSWLDFHKKPLELDRLEKKKYYAAPRKKVAYEVIPNRDQVYKMADASLTLKATLRNRAMILCLFQSGVRENCLCRWTYSMFKDQLYPAVKAPVKLVITAEMDTKLQSYDLGYYVTFLQRDAAEALKVYLDYRKQRGWTAKADDPVFVTESTASQGLPLEPRNIWEVIKQHQIAEAAGIDPRGMWARLLRKAFQKILNQGDIDEDTRESLMGHKLPGSRGNYFDIHDHDEIAAKYMRCQFDKSGPGMQEEASARAVMAILKAQPAYHALPTEKKAVLERMFNEKRSLDELAKIGMNFLTAASEEKPPASRSQPKKQHRTVRGRTARNGGTPLNPAYETRIVSEEELLPLLNQGYDVVKELTDGRIIVRRPLDHEDDSGNELDLWDDEEAA
jgi:site-specific recombinase XerD